MFDKFLIYFMEIPKVIIATLSADFALFMLAVMAWIILVAISLCVIFLIVSNSYH